MSYKASQKHDSSNCSSANQLLDDQQSDGTQFTPQSDLQTSQTQVNNSASNQQRVDSTLQSLKLDQQEPGASQSQDRTWTNRIISTSEITQTEQFDSIADTSQMSCQTLEQAKSNLKDPDPPASKNNKKRATEPDNPENKTKGVKSAKPILSLDQIDPGDQQLSEQQTDSNVKYKEKPPNDFKNEQPCFEKDIDHKPGTELVGKLKTKRKESQYKRLPNNYIMGSQFTACQPVQVFEGGESGSGVQSNQQADGALDQPLQLRNQGNTNNDASQLVNNEVDHADIQVQMNTQMNDDRVDTKPKIQTLNPVSVDDEPPNDSSNFETESKLIQEQNEKQDQTPNADSPDQNENPQLQKQKSEKPYDRQAMKTKVQGHFEVIKPHKIAERETYLANNMVIQSGLPQMSGRAQLLQFQSSKFQLEGLLQIKEIKYPKPLEVPKFKCLFHESNDLDQADPDSDRSCFNCENVGVTVKSYQCCETNCRYQICFSCLNNSTEHNNGVAILMKNTNHSKCQKFEFDGTEFNSDYQTKIKIKKLNSDADADEVSQDDSKTVEDKAQENKSDSKESDDSSKQSQKDQDSVFQLTIQIKDLKNANKQFLCMFQMQQLMIMPQTSFGSVIAALNQDCTQIYFFTQGEEELFLNQIDFQSLRKKLDNYQQLESQDRDQDNMMSKSPLTQESIDFVLTKSALQIQNKEIKGQLKTKIKTCFETKDDDERVEDGVNQMPLFYQGFVIINGLPVTKISKVYDYWGLTDAQIFQIEKPDEPIITFERTGSVLEIIKTQTKLIINAVQFFGTSPNKCFILSYAFGRNNPLQSQHELYYKQKIICKNPNFQLQEIRELEDFKGQRETDYSLYDASWFFFRFTLNQIEEEQSRFFVENDYERNIQDIEIDTKNYKITVKNKSFLIAPGIILTNLKKEEGKMYSAYLEYLVNDDLSTNIYFQSTQFGKLDLQDLKSQYIVGWNLSDGVNENSKLLVHFFEDNVTKISTLQIFSKKSESTKTTFLQDEPINVIDHPFLLESSFYSNKMNIFNLQQNKAYQQIDLGNYRVLKLATVGVLNSGEKTISTFFALVEGVRNSQNLLQKHKEVLQKYLGYPVDENCANCTIECQPNWSFTNDENTFWFCDSCYNSKPINEKVSLLEFKVNSYHLDDQPTLKVLQENTLFEHNQIVEANQVFLFPPNFVILYLKEQQKLQIRDLFKQDLEKEIAMVEEVRIGSDNTLYFKLKDKPTELFKVSENNLDPKLCFIHSKKFSLIESDCFLDVQSSEFAEKLIIIDEDNLTYELTKLLGQDSFKLFSSSPRILQQNTSQIDSNIGKTIYGKRIIVQLEDNNFVLSELCRNQYNKSKKPKILQRIEMETLENTFSQNLSFKRVVGCNKFAQFSTNQDESLIYSFTIDPDSKLKQILPIRLYKEWDDFYNDNDCQVTEHQVFFYVNKQILIFNAKTLMLNELSVENVGFKLVESNSLTVQNYLLWDDDNCLSKKSEDCSIHKKPKKIRLNVEGDEKLGEIIESDNQCICFTKEGKLILFQFVKKGELDVQIKKNSTEESKLPSVFTEEYQIKIEKELQFKSSALLLNYQNQHLVVYTASSDEIGIIDLKAQHAKAHTISLKNILQQGDLSEGFKLSYCYKDDEFFIDLRNHQIQWSISNLNLILEQNKKNKQSEPQPIGFQVNCLLNLDHFVDLQNNHFQPEKQGIFNFTPQSLKDIETFQKVRYLVTNSQTKQIFTPQSLLNIIEIDHMLIYDPDRDSFICNDTVIAQFPKSSTLHQLQDKDGWLDCILKQINQLNLQPYLDENQVRHDNIFLRILYMCLQQKFPFNKNKKENQESSDGSQKLEVTQGRTLNVVQAAFKLKIKSSKQSKHEKDSLQTSVQQKLKEQQKLDQQPDRQNSRDSQEKDDLEEAEDQIDQSTSQLAKNNYQGTLNKQEQVNCFDQYIQLLLLSWECKTTDVVDGVNTFYKLFKNSNTLINTFLEFCYRQTVMTQEITSVNWNPDRRVIAFGANTSLLNTDSLKTRIESDHFYWDQKLQGIAEWLKRYKVPKQIIQKIDNKDDWSIAEIDIRIYDISWLNDPSNTGSDETGKKFLSLMARKGTQKMYTNSLFNALLDEQYYSHQLLPLFAFYLIQIILQQIHFTSVLPSFETQIWHLIIIVLLIILLFFQLYQEILQIKNEKWNYIFSLLNLSQLFTVVLNLTIIIMGLAKQSDLASEEMEFILIIGPSISSFLMIVQVLDWLALFESTSFYVTMIKQSFQDIKYFLLFLIICIVAFTNAIHVINHNQQLRFEFNHQAGEEEYSGFIDEKINSGWGNTAISQYLLGLGEFETGEFNGDELSNYNVFNEYSTQVGNLLWFYFLIGTLLTQIVLMNTLIAILGDTFSMIVEKRDIYAIIQRTGFYADYLRFITLNEVVHQKFLYVIRPQENDEENQQWEGAVSSIKTRLRKNHETVCKELQNLTQRQENQVKLQNENIDRKIDNGNRMIERQLDEHKKKLEDKINDKINEIKGDMNGMQGKMNGIQEQMNGMNVNMNEIKNLLTTIASRLPAENRN